MHNETLWAFTPSKQEPAWIDVNGVPTTALQSGLERSEWPATQPGPLDASGDFRSHRISVSFPVESANDCVLALQFVSERGPCPDLEVQIDGHRGVFHPRVVRADRSGTGEPGPTAGLCELRVSIPADWLPQGRHNISVATVLDEAAALGDRQGVTHGISYRPSESLAGARGHYGSWFGAYIRWLSARLELSTVPEGRDETTIVLRPTPFFVAVDGNDVELVDCDVNWPAGAPRPEDITVHLDCTSLNVPPIPRDRDFGMFRWRFPAATFHSPASVRIDWSGGAASQDIAPCRKWQLHLIPHVHLDLGFTDAQGKVLELHCRNIDRALDLIDTDPRFRFNVDGSVIAQEYERTRSPEQVARMRSAIRQGSLGVNAFHSNFLTGLTGLAELFASTSFGLSLPVSETTGLRYANLTDVPTHARAIPSVLAEVGIDGFVAMSNHGRAATDTSDALHLMSPVRWQAPDGRELLAHFSDHYSQLRFIAADPQSLVGAADGFFRYLERYERPDFAPSDLAVIGTHADNEDLADGDVAFVDIWNAAFSWPRMRVSTFDEYLSAVAPLIDRLPVWRSESGSFWEDGVGSAAREFGVYRRAQVALPAAETFGTLVAARTPHLRVNSEEYSRAWGDLSVAAEHTLTWARSMSHPHASAVTDQFGWKRRYIDDAHRVSIDEPRRHAAQLAEVEGLIGPGVIAYNPHAWTADLDGEVELAEGTELIGLDGPVEWELLSSCAGMRRVRFRLKAMPAHSWRYLPMSTGLTTVPGGQREPTASVADADAGAGYIEKEATSIRSKAWRVELDPSTRLPTSVRHLGTGRELLDASAPHLLGQILRTAQTPFAKEESSEMEHPAAVHGHRRRRTLPIENFRYVPNPEPSALVIESPSVGFAGYRRNFDGVRLRWVGGGVGIASLEMELLLRDDSSMCDLDIRFVKQAVLDMEAVYVAFPFAAENPVVRYDRQLGWVEPAEDHGPGASNEWLAHTNTVSVQGDQGETLWTSLDAPLFTIGDVVRGAWPTEFPAGTGWVYSYAMNNYWPCNVPPTQSGAEHFAYRFGFSDAFDAAASGRFGRTARLDAHVTELVPLDRYVPGAMPEYREGRLGLEPDADTVDVHVLDDAVNGSAVYVVNLAAHPVSATVTLPAGYVTSGGPAEAERSVTVRLRPFGIERRMVTRT